MSFVHGHRLSKEMKRLVSKPGPIKIAIAYWGSDALGLLGISARRSNIEILCCLKGGKSDPDVIGPFKKKARQSDKLHAKVIWTPREALVGSANASSNGLPQEESATKSLIEAGLLIKDKGILRSINIWFDGLYNSSTKSRSITKQDLEDARRQRPSAFEKGDGRQSLLAALKQDRNRFKSENIYLMMYRDRASIDFDRAARGFLKNETVADTKQLHVTKYDIKKLTWYINFYHIPNDAYLISCRYENDKVLIQGVEKTLSLNSSRTIKVANEATRFTFALTPKYSNFSYILTKEDKAKIQGCARELWKRARGDTTGRVLRLFEASRVLLK